MNHITIGPSLIHGKGIFALRDFTAGETVLDWQPCSTVLSKKEVELLPEVEKQYVSVVDGKYILLQSAARFMNHSCEANTKESTQGDIAFRDIQKGEEITTNYIQGKVPSLEMNCNCGSRKCVKVVKRNFL